MDEEGLRHAPYAFTEHSFLVFALRCRRYKKSTSSEERVALVIDYLKLNVG